MRKKISKYRKQDTKSDGILYDPAFIRLVDPFSAAAFDGRGSLSPACSGRSGRWSSEEMKSWDPARNSRGPCYDKRSCAAFLEVFGGSKE
jgi:hypothetical protein